MVRGGGVVFEGRAATELYRLTVARHAVKLEAKGIKIVRGRSWTAAMRQAFGLSSRAPVSQVLDLVEKRIGELKLTARVRPL